MMPADPTIYGSCADDNSHVRAFRLFGITIAHARHHFAVRPAGEQLAVNRSFWIYTRRRSIGWVHARPWGLIHNLRVYVFGDCYETEGEIMVCPPRRFEAGEKFPFRIESRNQAAVNGSIRFECDVLPPAVDTPAGWAATRLFHAEPAVTLMVELATAPAQINKITYEIEPDPGANQWRRLYGRPEWERAESR